MPFRKISKRQYRKSKLKGGYKRKSKLSKKKQYRKLKLKGGSKRKSKLKGGSKRKSKLKGGMESVYDLTGDDDRTIYAELDVVKQQIEDNDNFSIIRISNDAPDPTDDDDGVVYTAIDHSGKPGASEVPNVPALGEVFANVTNIPHIYGETTFTYTPFPKEIKQHISILFKMYIGKRAEKVFDGLFLIRERDPPPTTPNEKLAISIFYNKKIVHVIIEESSQGFKIPVAPTDPEYFETLEELINYYGKVSLNVQSIPLKTKLRFFISGGEYDQTTGLVTMISKYNKMKEDLVQQIKKFNLEGVERKGSNVLTQGTKIMDYNEQILDDLIDINSTDNSKLDFIIFKMGKIDVKLKLTKEIVRVGSTGVTQGTPVGDSYDHKFDAYRVYFSVNNITYYIDIVNIDLNLEEMKTKYDVIWGTGQVGYKINKAGKQIITNKGYKDILSLISDIEIDINCTFVKDKDGNTIAKKDMPSITNTDGQSFEFNFRNQFTKA